MTKTSYIRAVVIASFALPLLGFLFSQVHEAGALSGASVRSLILLAIFAMGVVAFIRSREFVRGLFWFLIAIIAMLIVFPLTSGGF